MSEAVGLSIGIYYRNIRFLRTSEYIDIKQKKKFVHSFSFNSYCNYWFSN